MGIVAEVGHRHGPQGHAVTQTSMGSVLASIPEGTAQPQSLYPMSLLEALPPAVSSPSCYVCLQPRVSSQLIVTEPSERGRWT